MKKLQVYLCFFLVLSFFVSYSFGQNVKSIQEKYSKVKILSVTPADMSKLTAVDLHLSEGVFKPGQFFETWLSETEIGLLQKSGVSYTVLIPDWMEYYNSFPQMNSAQIQQELEKSIRDYNVSHSIFGTMGGHLKWEEAIAKLDSLRLQYPSLVSVKWSLGNSYENRPLWTIRITKNPDAVTGRPQIWYNGVTHAREPVGMSNVLYYIYWLVENYNIDPIATYILNNREIYWTPFINPDGYVYNQTTNPAGGGMWRKNRKDTGTDLNRNFGTYNFWNSTNNGSSTSPSSDTYRGPSPFSEPETQVFKNFENSMNFKVQLDYHTYGNYLIKPYAWCDPIPTPHDYVFNEYGNDIVSVNHFSFGTPYQTVGYKVRGGDLDWIYSTDSTGHSNHIYCMTPEVGTIGFWPPQSAIMGEVQTCLEMNKYMALVAGAYVGVNKAQLNKQTYLQGESGNLKVVFRNKGQENATNIKVELIPLTTYLNVPVQLYTKSSLSTFDSDSTIFNFTLAANTPNNSVAYMRLKVSQNDTVTMYDKQVGVFVGTGYSVLLDSAENGNVNFPTMTNWSIVTNKYLSPTHSFKGNCVSSQASDMVSVPLNVASYPALYLSFYHKYALESGYDYAYVDISSNNGTTWNRIATYNGVDSSTWKFQTFDITPYAGGATNLKIRFRDSCDVSLNYDGWYVDNIKLTGYSLTPTDIGNNGNGNIPSKFELLQNYPNPFNPVTKINFNVAKDGIVKISVFDIIGRKVATLINEPKTPGYYSVDFNATNLSSGMYFYRMEAGNFVETKKMMILK